MGVTPKKEHPRKSISENFPSPTKNNPRLRNMSKMENEPNYEG